MTPEGKVKAAISRCIKRYPDVYKYMPVPAGLGPSSLDYLLCVRGMFVGIEAKAPGKEPTARQDLTIREIVAAGGIVFIIDSSDPKGSTMQQLETLLRGNK